MSTLSGQVLNDELLTVPLSAAVGFGIPFGITGMSTNHQPLCTHLYLPGLYSLANVQGQLVVSKPICLLSFTA